MDWDKYKDDHERHIGYYIMKFRNNAGDKYYIVYYGYFPSEENKRECTYNSLIPPLTEKQFASLREAKEYIDDYHLNKYYYDSYESYKPLNLIE